jgi:hypothetical protein
METSIPFSGPMASALDRFNDARKLRDIHRDNSDLDKHYSACMIVDALLFTRLACDVWNESGVVVKFYD